MRNVLTAFLLVVLLSSCDAISSIIHDDQIVARVGDNKLYLSDIQKIIPEFASPEDSAGFAQNYINSWAKELLFADLAAKQLSPEELDVKEQLEDYRRSLLKYRYEQRYINSRLDTMVSESQIQEYYDRNKKSFVLERPVVKAVFVDIKKDARDKDRLLDLMASEDYEDQVEADTLALRSALRYLDCSGKWTDILVLAREFGMPYTDMLTLKKGSWIKYEPENRSELLAAYVYDCIYSGPAPVEYCESRIRDYILNARKHEIVAGLEQDLLKDALENNNFVIYK